MNIGDSQVVLLLAVDLFNELFAVKYRTGQIPNTVDTTVQVSDGEESPAVLALERPVLEVANDDIETYTRLQINGTVSVTSTTPPPGGRVIRLPLNTSVRLAVGLIGDGDSVPQLGFIYGGVDEPPAWPITSQMVDDLFTSGEVSTMLNNLRFDVVSPVINSFAEQLFPDGDGPPAEEWDVQILLLTEEDDNWPAIAILVAQPDTLEDFGATQSYLPKLNEFALIFSRSVMDDLLAISADGQVGIEIEEAVITRLELQMNDASLQIDGQAERDGAVVTFQGPIRLFLPLGSTLFAANTSDVKVDIDLPWYVDLLLFLSSPLGGFVTLGLGNLVGAAIFAITDESYIETLHSLHTAPGQVRGGIAQAVIGSLSQLTIALDDGLGVDDTPSMSTTNSALIEDGNLMAMAQVLVNPTESRIVNGNYSRRNRRFITFELSSGRNFSSTELARFIIGRMITVPGHHAVSGTRSRDLMYIRANADNRLRNNLLEQFR